MALVTGVLSIPLTCSMSNDGFCFGVRDRVRHRLTAIGRCPPLFGSSPER
ncbi:hypothetical protein AB0L42_24035 [Streptomyces sp. NPDC052287]|nr:MULTISPECIES: hypothetical protein [unclassified Streptomyces]QIY60367.1 hypothetical protein HEP85_09415 [Streptomyces sp. RPA4-2]